MTTSTRRHGLDEAAVAQTTKNIELAGEWLQEILADPALLDETPEGASLVLMPHDDPALADANLALAMQGAAEGRDVWLYRMRMPLIGAAGWSPTERRAFALKTIAPRWPTAEEINLDWVAIWHDRDAGTLLVDLFGGRRLLLDFPISQDVRLLVDRATHVVAGYFVEHASRQQAEAIRRLLDVAKPVGATGAAGQERAELGRRLDRGQFALLLQHAAARSA